MSRTQIQSPDIATGIVTSEKLAVTGVAAGTYSFATFTVNSKGQLTSAYSGSVSPGLVSPFYLNDLTDVVVPSPKNGQLLEFDGTNWVNAVRPSNEPIGHEDYTESTMSFDEGTRTFSIGPVSGSHTVWCTGVRYIKTTTETITIPDTTALYYIYYSSTGVLSYKTTFFTWDQDTPIAYIYWNADDNKAYYFSEERHGITLDWATHEYLHRTRGAAYASGFGVNNYTTTGNGSLDSHAQIDLANGTFFDEDLQIDITHSLSPVPNTFQQHIQSPGRFPIFYRTGSVWKRHSPTDFPIFYTTEANYNLNSGGSWSPVTLANNRYGISWLVATNNLTYPAMVVLGQGEYTNEAEYAAASWGDLDLSGFPSVEFRPLHKIVYQTSTAYANTPKSRIVAVYDLRTILPSGGVTSTPVSDHGALTGLGDDDHLQYLTSPRADTWLASKTTSNLTEGSNLYYTDERAQDAVGGMVSPSSTIRWTYNDTAGKIQAFLSPANVDHGSLGGLGDDDHTQYLTSPRANTWLGTKSIGALADVSPSAPTNGQVLTYHNASGQWRNQSPIVYVTDHGALTGLADDDHLQYLTSPRANTWLASKTTSNLNEGSNLYYTDERVQDAVGAMVSPSSTIRWSYNDTAGKIQAFVSPANISHASLSNLTTGDPHTQYQLRSEENSANGYMGLDASGRASPTRLGSGTPTSTVWLRGDGVWASVPFSPADAITVDAVSVKNPNFESTPSTTPLNAILVTWGLDNSTSPVDVYGYVAYSGLNTWLGTKTTSNLTEGSNLYYTDERAQDAFGAMVSPSSTIRWSYNDVAGKIQAFVSPANIDHGSLGGLGDDDHTQYLTSPRANTWLGTKSIGALSDVSPSTPTNGQVLTYHNASGQWRNQSPTVYVTDHGALTGLADDDHLQYLTSPRANTWLSTKTTSNLTEGSNLYYTDERVQDAVGAMVSPSSTIRWSYNDAAGKIQAFVSPANIDHGSLGGLTDDDHLQYLTSPRANAWLATKTTSNLTEGSNQYFTDERAQDAVALALTNTSTVKWTYNDGSNTIAADVSPAGISHASLANLTTGDPHTQYQLESEKNAANGYAGLNSSGLLSPSRIPGMPLSFLTDVSPSTPLDGQALIYHAASGQWRNSTLPTGVTDHGLLTGLADDDHTQYLTSPRANTWLATKTTSNLTEGSNLYYTDERVQDAVGAMMSPSSTIRWSYNDTAGKMQAFVSPANISHATLSNLTTGDPHTQYQLKSEKNSNSGYAGLDSSGQLSPTRIANDSITFARFQNINSDRLVGRDTAGSGDPAEISVTDGLAFTGSDSIGITANGVTNAMLAQMGASTIKGNNTAGTANAADLSPAQVTAMLNVFTSTLKGLAPASGGGTGKFLRADGSWASPSTTSISEGTNLYYTDERAQDAFGAMVSPSTTIRWSYNDAAGKIQAFVSPANISHASLSDLTTGDPHTQYQLESEKNAANGYMGLDSNGRASPTRLGSGTPTSAVWLRGDGAWASVPFSPADAITVDATAVKNPNFESTPGTPPLNSIVVTWGLDNMVSPVDVYGYITYSGLNTWLSTKTTSNLTEGSNLYYTDERAQDAFGAMVSPSTTIRWSYNDTAGKIQAFVSPANISHASLANLTAGDPHTQYQLESEKNAANGYPGLDAAGLLSPSRVPGMPLSFLTDVSPSTPLDGQALIYHAASGQWRNATLPSGVTDHGLLTGLSDDDHLQYLTSPRADTWLGTKSIAALSDVSPSTPTSGQVLTYDHISGQWRNQSPTVYVTDHGALTGLTDDDHLQYLTSPRANTWLATKTTSNLTEGSNLYYTDERVQDAVGIMMSPSSTIRWSYNDAAGKMQAFVSPANISHADLSNLTTGDPHTQYQLESEKNAIGGYAGLDASGLVSPSRIPAMPLSFLSDVSPGTPTNGQVLAYHTSSGQWRSQSPTVYVTDHGALTGLADDDHTQYLTSPRANTWLATKTTSNLTEGSNLYYTDERVQDAVGAMVSPSSTVRWSYNDAAGKIQAFVSPANIDHGALGGLSDDDHLQYLTSPRANTWLATKTTSDLTEGANQYFTDERAQDAVALALTNTSTIKWTYNDASNLISASVSPAGISHASLANLTSGDPHTQYQLRSEENAANGYMGLDASGRASPTRLGSGTPTSSVWLRGDGIWASVPFSPADAITVDAVAVRNPNFESTPSTTPLNSILVTWGIDNATSPVDVYGYITYSGLNTWLGTKTTSNITEGSNLYYTDERAQDAFGAMVSPSATIRWSYNDAAGKIQAFVSPANIDHGALGGLSDDDHLQYLTSPRANTWLGTKTTTNLTEGSNLYYTDERVQDAVGVMVSPSSTVRWSYNDTAGKMQAFVSPANISHASLADLTTGDPHTQYQLESEKNTVNGYAGLNASGLLSPSRIPGMPLSFLTDVSPSTPLDGQALIYHAASGQWRNSTLPTGVTDHGLLTGLADDDHTQYLTSPRADTWFSTKTTSNLTEGSNLYYTDERVQDAVGAMVSPSSTIRWTYDDAAGKVQAIVSPANISHAALSNLTTGDPHTQYQLESEKNAANGYAGLNASGLLSPSRIPGMPLSFLTDVSPGTPTNGQVLTYHTSSAQWRSQSPTVYVTDHGLLTGLADDDHTQYLTSPRANTWLATKTTSNLTEGSNLYYTDERVQDAVGAMMSPSSTIRWSYNDTAGKMQAFVSPANISHAALSNLTTGDPHTQYLTSPRADTWLASKTTSNLTEGSNQYFTNERAQDAVALALTNTSTIKWTYNDGGNTISADVSPAGISHASLANLTTGDPHTQYQLKSEKNANSGYAGLDSSGQISPTRIADDSITFARFQNINSDRLVGRDAVGSGDPTEISVTNGLAFTGSDSIGISTNAVTNAMLAQMGASTIKGNNTAGTANATDLSPAQVTAMLNVFTSTLKGLAPASGGGTGKFLRADGSWASPSTTSISEGTNLYYTDERAQDAFGSMVSPSSTIRWSYDDTAGKIQAFVSPANISHASLANLTTGDPHTQYQLKTEKNAANGYMGLDSGGRASPTRLGSGTATSTVWLRGDGVWAAVPFSPADAITVDATAVKNPNFESTPATTPLNSILVTWGLDNSTSPVDVYGYIPYAGLNTWLGTKTTSNLTEGSNLYYTDERAQDAFGLMVSPSSTIRWSYNDAAGKIQAFVSPANISHADLSNLTTGDPHTQYQLESEKNSANGYAGLDSSGQLSPTRIANDSITFARFQNINSDRLVGRDTAGSGDPAEISVTNGIAFTGSDSIGISTNGVTNAMLAQMGANTIKGNNTAGTANSTDLSPAQVTAMLNVFTSTLKGLAPASGGGTGKFLRADGSWASPSTTSISEGTNLYYTDERAQDAFGAMVSPSSTVRWTYNDTAGKMQAFVSPANIDHGLLQGLANDDHTQYALLDGTRPFNFDGVKIYEPLNTYSLTIENQSSQSSDHTLSLAIESPAISLTMKGSTTLRAGGDHGGTNTGDVTLTGTPDYITISGQIITRGQIDLTTDVTGDLPLTNLVQATSPSVLLGRNSTTSGDFEEIRLGAGLSMSGTNLGQDILLRVLDADETVSNINTAQQWFPTAGSVSVTTGTYIFDGTLYLTTGTTSHSLLLKFDSGTATISSFTYRAIAQSVLAGSNALAQSSTWNTSAAQNTVLAASTTAARWARIEGVARFSAAGTFIPEFRFSAQPGGTNVAKSNSYFRMLRVGSPAISSIGTWS